MNRTAQPNPGEKGLLPTGIRRAGGGVAFLAAWGVSILVGISFAIVLGIVSSTDGGAVPVVPWTLVLAPQPTIGP